MASVSHAQTEADSPIADPGSNRVITPQNAVQLDGTGSISPTNTALSYAWELTQIPDGSLASLNNPNSPRPDFTPDLAGSYIAALTVSDSSGNISTTQTVTLSTENLPPVTIAGPDRSMFLGETLRLDPEGTYDPNGDRLSATWSILSTPIPSESEVPAEPANNNTICPSNGVESLGTFHVVSATSNQQSPHLAVGQPLPEGTTETGNNSATTYYGPITMDLTGDPSIFVPEGELIDIVLSSAWGTAGRAEILMSADGETYTSLGTVGAGGSAYPAYSSNILRYDEFTVPAGGARFLQVFQQNAGIRADGVIYQTQCQSPDGASSDTGDDTPENTSTLIEDEGGRYVFTPDTPGEYAVQLLVEDGLGGQSTDIVTIFVGENDGSSNPEDLNIAPIANAGTGQLVTIDQTVTLDATQSTDVNGDTLSYLWTILSKPADSFRSIEDETSPIASFTPDTDRLYVLQLEVTDGFGAKAYDTFILDGSAVNPVARSGGPDAWQDGAIVGQLASVDGSTSLSGNGQGIGLAYQWSVLGLSDGESEIETPENVSTSINFQPDEEDNGSNIGSEGTVALLSDYNVIVFNDLDSNVDIAGRAFIGGQIFGQSSTFGTQLPQGQNIDALTVIGDISGGPKNINNGGNVRHGGQISTQVNLNGGGQLISDDTLSIGSEQAALISLSTDLSGAEPNSITQIPDPFGQHGPARLNATPNEDGIAVFNIEDGNLLFRNDRVQQIEVNANDADTIIVNIGGADIDFTRGNFVGAVQNNDTRQRIIWNFHEATDLFFDRAVHGTVLAPNAHLFNRTNIFGAVVVDSFQARGPISLPGFNGGGLENDAPSIETNFALVQLTVSDTNDGSLPPAHDSVILTTGNLRPVANITQTGGENPVETGEEITLDGTSSSDGDSDTLSYDWSLLSKPSGSSLVINANTTPSQTHIVDASGTYVFQLVVNDGELASRAVTYTVTTGGNEAPIANAGPDQAIATGQLVSLNGGASQDPDGDALNYSWSFTSRPAGSEAVLTNANSVSPDFETDIPGDYVIALVVDDGELSSDIDEVRITSTNIAPTAVISGPSTGEIGEALTFTGVGSSDVDGDDLSYIWTVATPDGSNLGVIEGSDVAFQFMPDVSGDYIVSLTVSDGFVLSEAVTNLVTIEEPNSPPVLDVIDAQTISVGSTASVQFSASDPDGDDLTFSVSPSPLPTGASLNSDTGLFTYSALSRDPDSLTFNVTVSDGEASSTGSFSISVTSDNVLETTYSGQVVDAVTGQAIAGARVFTLTGETTLTDSNGEFTLTDIPSGSVTICVEVDGQEIDYTPLRYATNLIEFVDNQESAPIQLARAIDTAVYAPAQTIILENTDNLNVRVEIPADSFLGGTGDLSAGDIISLSALSAEDAISLPTGVEPCGLFVLGSKSLPALGPINFSTENFDNLPDGTEVDLWMFRDTQFEIIGTGLVQSGRIETTVEGLIGGAPIGFAPRIHQLTLSSDQPGTYLPRSLLGDGALRTVIGLPSYGSLGGPDTTGLIYNSRAADGSALITGTSSFGDATPETVTSTVSLPGTAQTFENVINVNGQSDIAQSAVVSGEGLESGVYPVNFLSIARYSCSTITASTPARVPLEDGSDNPFGPGWSVAEIQRLNINDQGVSIRQGDGSVLQFDAPVPTIFEDFSDNFGGWGLDGLSRGLSYQPTGGNPGGHLQEIDILSEGQIVYWRAPDGLLPRLTEFIGGIFSYDMRQSNATRQFGVTEDVVVETSLGERLFFDYPDSVFPGTAWTRFEIPLRADAWNIRRADNSVDTPTDEEFQSLLENATVFRFRAEHRTGSDTVYLDNAGFGPETTELDNGQLVSTSFESVSGDFSTLELSENGTFERRYPDGTQTIFDQDGLHIATIDRNGNQTSYAYDENDRVTDITDPSGQVTRFIYQGNTLASIIDPSGRETLFAYDSTGALVEVTEPDAETTMFTYDDNARLISMLDPRGFETTHDYDASGSYQGSTRPDGTSIGLSVARSLGLDSLGTLENPVDPQEPGSTQTVDGRGNVTNLDINEFGAIIRSEDPLGRVTTYERDENNLVRVIDEPSSVTESGRIRSELDYDVRGNVTARREAVATWLEREMTYEYEPVFSQLIRMVDYDGFESVMTYDDRGNKLSEVDPEGGEYVMTYDDRGLLVTQSDKVGNITTYEYDQFGRLERMIDPSNDITRLTLDAAGNVLIRTEAVGTEFERRILMGYDEQDRLILETAADGGTTNYIYDDEGNLSEMIDPTGVRETWSYDSRDRPISINDPASGTTTIVYDEDSNVINMTDPLGETTEFTYDSVSRRLTSIDAKGQLRAVGYDLRDNITMVTDARSNATFIAYDKLDRPITRTNPKVEQWNFTYDRRDNRISATKPDGVILISEYDGLSRLIRISGGDIERNFSFDAQSNLLSANDNLAGVAGAELGFSYDQENRVKTASVSNLFGKASVNNIFSYDYDALDRRATMSDSFDGNWNYGYDPVDRLTQVTTPRGESYSTEYDLAGRMLSRMAPNATAVSRNYEDDTGLLSQEDQTSGAVSFNGYNYNYSDRGNIQAIEEFGSITRTRSYNYDELERLTSVDSLNNPNEIEIYSLDPEGNRLTSHLSNTHETDDTNRLTEDENYSYVYDLNGNLLSKSAKPGIDRPDWIYNYDAFDQLITVSRDGIEVERYRYDAFGRRSTISTRNADGNFVTIATVNNDSNRTIDLIEIDDGLGASAQIKNRYSYSGEIDEPLSVEVFNQDGSFDQAYSYHTDHLGSIRFITDSVGEIVNSYDYDSYGRPSFTLESIDQPFRYTGREFDQATELYHYRARQYDPETGKFIQEDPIWFQSDDYNVYRYVTNNPLNYSDPSGLTSASETGATSASSANTAGSLFRIGRKLACNFGSIASVFSVVGTGPKDRVAIDRKGCGASSLSKKQIQRVLKTACRTVEANGRGPQRKGQRLERILVEIVKEIGIETIAAQTHFNVDTGILEERRISDLLVKEEKTTIDLEFKGGKRSGLTSAQKRKLSKRANLVLQFGCKTGKK